MNTDTEAAATAREEQLTVTSCASVHCAHSGAPPDTFPKPSLPAQELYLQPEGSTLQHRHPADSHCHGNQLPQQSHPAVICFVPLGAEEG